MMFTGEWEIGPTVYSGTPLKVAHFPDARSAAELVLRLPAGPTTAFSKVAVETSPFVPSSLRQEMPTLGNCVYVAAETREPPRTERKRKDLANIFLRDTVKESKD